jgi:hypothetical protein
LVEILFGEGDDEYESSANEQKSKLQTDFIADVVRFLAGRRELFWFRVHSDFERKLTNE